MLRLCLFALVFGVPATTAVAQIDHPLVTLEGTAWSARPSDAQLASAKPAGVKSRGYVILKCGAVADGRLTDCAPYLEDPRGQGFGTAALSLVPAFRLDPSAARFVHEAGAKVSVQFSWINGEGGPCWPPYCSFIPPPPPPPCEPRQKN